MKIAKYNDCIIAQIIEGNAYFGDLGRYRSMSSPELKAEHARLKSTSKRLYIAFLLHPTVQRFALLIVLLNSVAWWVIYSPENIPALLVAFVALPIPLLIYCMRSERQPLMDAMDILSADIKAVNAFIAIREIDGDGTRSGKMLLLD